MNIDPEHISQEEMEVIERYLHGNMSKERQRVFAKRMNEDENFRRAVYEYQQLIEGIETASLKIKLDEFHAEIGQQSSTSANTGLVEPYKNRPFIKYVVAASLVLAFGLAIWFVALQQTAEEKLFAANFEPDPGLITPMSSTDEYEFYSGMIDYKQENYQEAISKWEPLIFENPGSDTLNYFLGVAHLALGDQEQAQIYLEANLETANGSFMKETYYYLGLAYLKSGNRSAAVQALTKTDDERAADLLIELKKQE